MREASGDEREHLLDGAAAAAGELLLEGTAPAGDSAMLIAHSMLWLCSAIAERRPLALVVDDAQWADRSSLEVLSYLARRVDDLPLLILIGARADDPDAASDLLTPARLGPLGDRPAPAAADAARRDAADPPAGTGDARPRSAATVIARSAATRGCWASSAARSPPTAPRRSRTPSRTRRRSPRSPAPSCAGAWRSSRRATAASSSALAVIGDGAPPHVVAAVAGVPVGELGPARDALLVAGPARPAAASASRTA